MWEYSDFYGNDDFHNVKFYKIICIISSAVTPDIPKNADTPSESILTGINTFVKPEHKFTAINAIIPESMDIKDARTGVFAPDIL